MNEQKEQEPQIFNRVIMDDRSEPPTDSAIALVSEGIKARMQLAFFMAAKNKRSYDHAKIRIIENCKRFYDPDPKKGMMYRKPVSDKREVVGLNIRWVEMALREWQNVYTDVAITHEDAEKRRFKVSCIDLETNTHFCVERTVYKKVERHNAKGREVIGKRHTSDGGIIYIVRATDEETDTRMASEISKVIRNEGARLIPIEIKEDSIHAIYETAKEKGKNNPDAEKDAIISAFLEIGIYPKDIESLLGHTLDRIEPHELIRLREIFSTIRDGEATWNDYVQAGNGDDGGGNGGKKPPKDEKELAESLKQRQSVGDAGAGKESGEPPVGMAGNEAGGMVGTPSASPSPEIIEGERKAILNKITGALPKVKGGMQAFNNEFAKTFPALQNITQLDLDGARVMWEWMQEQNKKG